MAISRSAAAARRSAGPRPGSAEAGRADTMPGWLLDALADHRRARPGRVRPHRRQHRRRPRPGARTRPACPRWRPGGGRGPATSRRWRPPRGPAGARSSSAIPTPDADAISFSEVATPPRVGSRSTCRSCVTASIAATRPFSGAQSLRISVPNSQPLAHAHDRDAVHADVAADDDHVARTRRGRAGCRRRRAPARCRRC